MRRSILSTLTVFCLTYQSLTFDLFPRQDNFPAVVGLKIRCAGSLNLLKKNSLRRRQIVTATLDNEAYDLFAHLGVAIDVFLSLHHILPASV